MQIKYKWILPAICAISLIIMCVALVRTGSDVPGRFAPPSFDTEAVSGIPGVPENLGYTPVNVDEGYNACVCGVLSEKAGRVAVYFTADSENTVWLRLRMLDTDGNILGETGVIRPGEYVAEMTLDTVPETDVAVQLKIMGYTPDTWHSAGAVILNTTLEVED